MKDFNEEKSTSSVDSQSSEATAVSLTTSNEADDSLVRLSLVLNTIFNQKSPESLYTEGNYLEHAQRAVDALKTLFLKTSTAAQAKFGVPTHLSKQLFKKIIKELNNLYELLEDCGWQCAQQPDGLIPASTKRFMRFMDTINLESVQKSVSNIHRLTKMLESARYHQALPTESLAQTAQTAIQQLVKKIKSGSDLSNGPLIVQNPNIIYQSDNQESQCSELGFTPLLYAAKYSSNPGIFKALLRHISSKTDRKYLITKPIQEAHNPLVGSKPIMLCAHYAKDNMLEALLNELSPTEQHKEVTFICKKGEFKGWSALHFACYNFGNRQASRDEAPLKVQRLLSLGADINGITQTPPIKDALILAVETGQVDLIRLLIYHGIQTPLHHPELNHTDIIRTSQLSDAEKLEFIKYVTSIRGVGLDAENPPASISEAKTSTKRKATETTIDNREGLLDHLDDEAKRARAQQIIQTYAQTHGLKLGKAFGEGDCFFDCFSQGLQNLFPDFNKQDVAGLRQICKIQAFKPNPWLVQALAEEQDTLEQYRQGIEFCHDHLKYGEIHGRSTPIWGRPHIEGRLLCEQFNVRLHVTEVCEVDGQFQLVESCIPNAPEDQADQPTIYIMVSQHTLHFVPLLPQAFSDELLPTRMSHITKASSSQASSVSTSFFNDESTLSNSSSASSFTKK